MFLTLIQFTNMKIILTSIFYIFAVIPLFASQTKADSLYTMQKYMDAVIAYQEMLSEGINDDIFYNIGNCYYRMNEYPRAILNYQKTLKMNPKHTEARDNLQLCLQRVGAQEYTNDELFYTTWLRALIGSNTADGWGRLALLFWALFLGAGVVYLLAHAPLLKKLTFFLALIFLLLAIVMNVFAYKSKQRFYRVEHLVVMKSTPLYESATSISKQIGEVPEGAVLKFNETFDNKWFNVSLPDGRTAWCEQHTVEKVEL